MIMNDATASACLALIASGRGKNQNASGTAMVITPEITLWLAGPPPMLLTRGAARAGCWVLPPTELALQSFAIVPAEAESCAVTLTADDLDSKRNFPAGRIVAPESSKLHSSRCRTRKFPHPWGSAPNPPGKSSR